MPQLAGTPSACGRIRRREVPAVWDGTRREVAAVCSFAQVGGWPARRNPEREPHWKHWLASTAPPLCSSPPKRFSVATLVPRARAARRRPLSTTQGRSASAEGARGRRAAAEGCRRRRRGAPTHPLGLRKREAAAAAEDAPKARHALFWFSLFCSSL